MWKVPQLGGCDFPLLTQNEVSRAWSGCLLVRTPHLALHVSCALRLFSMASCFALLSYQAL